MWDSLISYGIQTGLGIFGLLFVMLLGTAIYGVRWVFKMNNEREQRYISVIEKQADSLKSLDEAQRDIKQIKEYIYRQRP
ncbi:hypothetical protein JSY36_04460 [Bacillus sp. H-16]|uniref:BhlA/UviB family holin-like peptide n=1 Tax=Alteribacter salitolerans TaxID=2912333 RepID=UPI001964B4A5|nr:BhlA/UviB family holin-like peptide [Alteribacter salitolerans]MBM7095004.1 hypothetical protein [Alteribacter salitolerans]